MTLPIWAFVAILVAATVIAGAIAFVVGRKTAADTKRIADLETELSTQRGALESVNAGVNTHFEESAKLLGQLAQDYRALFEHFTSTASNLGLSERRAEAIRVAVETELLPRDGDEDPVAEVSLDPTAPENDGSAAPKKAAG